MCLSANITCYSLLLTRESVRCGVLSGTIGHLSAFYYLFIIPTLIIQVKIGIGLSNTCHHNVHGVLTLGCGISAYLVLGLVKTLVEIWLCNDYCIMILYSTILTHTCCNSAPVICTVLHMCPAGTL
jgi:hypothetical protein